MAQKAAKKPSCEQEQAGDLEKVTEEGGEYERLQILSLILAKAIDECESKRDLSSLAKRYMDVSQRLAVTRPHTQSRIDELVAEGQRRYGTRFQVIESA